MNEVRFTPTPDDLIAAYKLHQLAVLPRFALWVGGAVLLVLIAIFMISNGDWPAALIFALGVIITTLVALLVARFWSIPRVARKAIAHDKALTAPWTFSWDADRAKAASDCGHWEQPLSGFICWKADRDMLLLYRQTQLFHFFPTRAFPEGQRDDLIAALKAAGVATTWPPR